MRRLILSAFAAAVFAVLVVVQVARCDLIWPVPNVSPGQEISPSATFIRGVALSDSATVFSIQMSPDSSTWMTVATDTAYFAQPAVIDSVIPLPGWFKRVVLQPLNSVAAYTATGLYDAQSFLGSTTRGARSEYQTTGLAGPDPAMTTSTNFHTFTMRLGRSDAGYPSVTDSMSVNLVIESPWIYGASHPTTATAKEDTNWGPADSSGVDWFQLHVEGQGPEGVYAGNHADSVFVAQGHIITFSVKFRSRGAGVASQTVTVIPPAGWTTIDGADHVQLVGDDDPLGAGFTVQYRAPVALTSPLAYLGCFRIPRDLGPPPANESNCSDPNWGNIATYGAGRGLAYCPDHDTTGSYPGTLYITARGEDSCYDKSGKVAEVSIPAPIRSFNKDSVNVATVIQEATNIRGTPWTSQSAGTLQREGGLLYLPAKGAQSEAKLYSCFSSEYTNNTDRYTHEWADADMTTPDVQGAWHVGPFVPGGEAADVTQLSHFRKTTGYYFAIPDAFVSAHLGDSLYFACGKSDREAGTQGSNQGPSSTAIGPETNGNPPAPQSELSSVPLLLYPRPTNTLQCSPGVTAVDGYNTNDFWKGAFWPSKRIVVGSDTTAVVGFVGTRCRYSASYWTDCPTPGCPDCDGPAAGYPDCLHCGYPGTCNEGHGFTCGAPGDPAPGYKTVVTFYDEDDMADVADGLMDPWEPQPIMEIDISGYVVPECQPGIHGVAWNDRDGLVYVAQGGIWASQPGNPPRVAIHVFQVELVP